MDNKKIIRKNLLYFLGIFILLNLPISLQGFSRNYNDENGLNLFEKKEQLSFNNIISKTVIVKGQGLTLNEANIQAAQNALLLVLGSYIDSDSLIKKQKTIINNISESSVVVDKKINSYSKGSIDYFEIIKQIKKGDIYYVTAKVTVNLDKILGDSNKNFSDNELENNQEIQKVLVLGLGKTKDLAFKSAINNALFQVKGSFIDREQIIKNSNFTQNGETSSAKEIVTNTREFSKGLISKVEVISTKKVNNLYELSALVHIDKKEFTPFKKELGNDKQEIEQSLFTSIIKDSNKGLDNTKKLLKVFDKLKDGSAYVINVGQPKKLSKYLATTCKSTLDTYKDIDHSEPYVRAIQRDRYFAGNTECFESTFTKYFNKNGTIVIPFTISLEKNYKKNLLNLLSNIEDKSIKNMPLHKSSFQENDDLQITFFDRDNEKKNIYRIRDVKRHIRQNIKEICHPLLVYAGYKSIDSCPFEDRNKRYSSLFLEISFLDSSGKDIKIMKIHVNAFSKNIIRIVDSCNGYETVQKKERYCYEGYRWRGFVGSGRLDLTNIFYQYTDRTKGGDISSYRNYLLIFDDQTLPLSRLDSISIRYIN